MKLISLNIIILLISFKRCFFGDFINKGLDKIKNQATTTFQKQYNNLNEKFNPFTPDKNDIFLKDCDYKFNPKKFVPQIPVDNLICMPRHVEFGRAQVGSYAIWIFFCDYESKVLDSQLILRVNAKLSLGEITSMNMDFLKDEKKFTWLVGTDKRFLLANLLETDSLRCNQVKRILSSL